MNEDQQMWQGLQLGNRDMFLALYKKYYHLLLFVGLKQIKDAHLIKDAIHQLFLYLWEKRSTIDTATDVKSYLLTAFLRKLSADHKKLRRNNMSASEWNKQIDEQPLTPEEKLENKDQQNYLVPLLEAKLNGLPGRQRELIELRFYEGLNYDEIVLRTGLCHRTVYNKIHEGIKKLKLDITQHRFSYAAML